MDKKYLMLVSIPMLVILGFALSNLSTVIFGQEIVLEVIRPIDPLDLFRGNYAILNYEISELDLSDIRYDNSFNKDETIYAILYENKEVWQISRVMHIKPSVETLRNGICLKGKVTYAINNEIGVEWGIESFFAPENIALEVEKAIRDKDVFAIVNVDSSCNPVIKSLMLDDEVVKLR